MAVASTTDPDIYLQRKTKPESKKLLSSWHVIIMVLKFVMLVSVSRTGLLTQSLIVFSVSFCI